MAEVGSAFVSIMPSARGFGRATERQLGGEMRSSGSRLGATMGRALMIGGAAAIGAGFVAAKFLKGAIDEAQEAAVVTARTENVIESMGNAAKISAKQVADMAGRLSNLTGVDDEAIQSGENLLLTFGNIRNFVDGKFVGTFDQATALMVDMSKAMGTDMKGAAIQIGKALNDPVKGLTALSRVGVSFTEQQAEQIKTMTESGDVLSAQNIILGELERQFGGAAEAMATPAEKAEVAWSNLKEQLGTQLLPVFNKVATSLSTDIIPAVSKFIGQMQSGRGSGGEFANILSNIGTVIRNVAGWVMNDFLPAWQSFASWVQTNILPGVQDLISGIGSGLRSAFDKVNQAIQDHRPLIDAMIEGVKRLGKWIGDTLLPALGEWYRVALPKLGDAFRIALDVIEALIDTTLTFVIVGSRAFRMFLQVVMITFGKIVEGAAIAFGWMPKIGGKVKDANAAFQSLGNEAIGDLRKIEEGARRMGAALDQATRNRTITITTFHNDVFGGQAGGGGHEAPDPAVRGKTAAPMSLPKVALDDDTIGKLGKVITSEKGALLLASRRTGR